MRSLALILALFISATATAFQPRIGLWGNTAESGSGYMIDIQNGLVALTAYSYQSAGPSQWYLASGPLTNNGHNFFATLDKYVGGQCISCTYRPASLAGNDGTIAITFQSETLATLTLPGGRTTVIQPFDFGYGPLPDGLLGEWIFVYDIVSGGTTFAERFNLTTTAAGTSTGSGLALDVTRRAACELQISGSFAGFVFCVDLDSANNPENQYIFRYGLDETFGGSWVSPTTFNQYPMKGFRVASKTGLTRSDAPLVPEGRVHALKADVSPPSDARVHALKTEMAVGDGGRPPTASMPEFVEFANALRSALARQ